MTAAEPKLQKSGWFKQAAGQGNKCAVTTPV
jgi:hypothetical protein